MERPDHWLCLEITLDDGAIVHKILAGWNGGYLQGNSWRLNSGIKHISVQNDKYIVYGYSGSKYHCFKHNEENAFSISGVLHQLQNTGKVEVKNLEDVIERNPKYVSH